MKFQRLSTSICLVFGTVLAISSSAQAANFTTNFEQKNGAEGDIILKSVTQNGKTISDFSFVTKAVILQNTPIKDVQQGDTSNPEASGRNNNTGAASTDKGDKASAPLGVSGMKDPTGQEVAAFLGNSNLNNIIDTEDSGSFKINVFFDSLIKDDNTGLDNLLFWERGQNSDLGIQAVDAAGNLIGNFLKLARTNQSFAGYSIDTTEIGGAQKVGSWGVSLKQLGVTSLAGIQLTANSSYNGPDFKVVARQSVPEPGTVLGLGVMAGLGLLRRRRCDRVL